MSVSASIALELQRRLQAISVFAGFNTDAGQNVVIGWRNLEASAIYPNLTLVETGHAILSDAVRGVNVKIQIQWSVEGLALTGGETVLPDLYAIEADVLRAIFADDLRVDGRFVRLIYGGREISPPEEGGKLAAIRVNLTTEHSEQLL